MFSVVIVVATIFFVCAPVFIAWAPYESTMGLVQKIFYFHVPSWAAMFVAAFVCGIASAVFLFRGRLISDRIAVASAELAVVFGLIGLVSVRCGPAKQGAGGGKGMRDSPWPSCAG